MVLKATIITLLCFSYETFANYLPYSDSISSEHIHEFCADNQVFSFSRQACPGGVLLKSPIELTEPCHCINQHMTIYSPCELHLYDNNYTNPYPRKVCHRTQRKSNRRVLVKLVQPSGPSLKHKGKSDASCRRIRSDCSRLQENTFSHGINAYGKISSVSYQTESDFGKNITTIRISSRHREKRQAKAVSALAHIADLKLRKRVEETISYLNELQLSPDGPSRKIKPKSMSLQVLAKTVEIYNNIAPSVIIEDDTLTSILALFLEKYAKLELPGFSGKLYIDDHLNEQGFNEVMAKLKECSSRSTDSSQELEFLSELGQCPAEITHVIHRAKGEDFGFTKVKHELGQLMPENRKYMVEREDFVLGVLWKVFDTIYSYCFSYTFSYHNAQIMVDFHNMIENIFTSPWVYPDYNVDGGTSMYSTRIEHEDLSVLMKNIDLMDEAVHILSKFKPFFIKPLSATASGDVPTSKRKRSKRQRRSTATSNGVNWSDLEIWGGRAYCLQTSNPDLPASVANAYPNIDDVLCTDQY